MPYQSPLLFNPAFTGLSDFGRVKLNFQNEFRNKIKKTYESYDIYVGKLHGGLGFYHTGKYIFTGQNYLSTNSYSLNYSYQGKIKQKWDYSVGANVTYSNSKTKNLTPYYSINSNGNTVVTYDKPTTTTTGKPVLNGNLGGIIYSDKLFFGVSVHNIAKDAELVYKSFIGYTFELSSGFIITPSLTYRTFNFNFTEFDFSIMSQYKNMRLGGRIGTYYYSFQAGYELSKFNLIYSFSDYYKSNISNYRFSHQITLQLNIPNKIDRKSNAFTHLLY